MIRTLALALALSITALVAAGCGDSTTSEYVDGYNAAVEKMEAVGTAFSEAKSVEDLTAARADLDEAIGAFDALTPPDSVKSDHEALVAELQSTSKALANITEESTPEQDQQTTNTALDHLTTAEKTAEAIRKELNG